MPINLPPPSLNEDMFATCCETLPLNVKEQIASTYPFYFSPAFVFGEAPATPEPAKPPLAKTKAPASTTAKPRERAISLSTEEHDAAAKVVEFIDKNAGTRSRDIPTSLDGRSKSRVLAWLVSAKMLSVQGQRAGARYYPVNGTPETADPEQAE